MGRDQLDAALSVTTVAAGRLDVGEGSEIEIGEGLESLGSGAVSRRLSGSPATLHTRPVALAARPPHRANAEGGCVDRLSGACGSRRAKASSSGGRDSEPGAQRCSTRARRLVCGLSALPLISVT